MQTLFHLVRHGSYDLLDRALGGRGDHPLSPDGRAQAERVATALRRCQPAAVVSSPVRRALETAAPIASRMELPLQSDPAFAEIDYARWTGVRFEDLRNNAAWQAWNRFRSTATVPGGERMLAVQARAIAGLTRYAAGCQDGDVVIVSHADVIKAVLTYFLGAPLDLMHRMEISPGSISRLSLYQDDAKVLAINVQP